MLPQPASVLDLGFAPDRLAWTRRNPRLFRAPIRSGGSQAIASQPEKASWEGALAALDEVLKRESLPAGSLVNVELSSHFARFVLVPWNESLRAERERLAVAERSFHAVYGDAATGWDVRLSNDVYGAPALATAVDKTLLEALSRTVAALKLRLGSVQPYFMAAFNRFRHQLGRRGAFVLAEPGKIVVGSYDNDRWRWIGSSRFLPGQDLATQVQQLLFQGQQWDITTVAVCAGTSSSDYWRRSAPLFPIHLLLSNATDAGPGPTMALCGGA